MNMSYCQFHNTLNDLGQCEDTLEQLLNSDLSEALSREELQAAISLVERCQRIVSMVTQQLPSDCRAADLPEYEMTDHEISDVLTDHNNEVVEDSNEE